MFNTFSGLRRLPALLLSGAILSAAMISCGNDECYDNHNALPLAELYSSAQVPQAVSIDSISVWGVGVPNDSLILDAARNVSQISFPFRIDEQQTSFVIRYDALRRIFPDAPDDTITFSYRNIPFFESQACGVFYRFDNVEISHTEFLIDSVTCPEGYIDNTPAANLKIFFRSESSDTQQ